LVFFDSDSYLLPYPLSICHDINFVLSVDAKTLLFVFRGDTLFIGVHSLLNGYSTVIQPVPQHFSF
jgi:hypothetical protein